MRNKVITRNWGENCSSFIIRWQTAPYGKTAVSNGTGTAHLLAEVNHSNISGKRETKKTILLVEDEAPVREALARVLSLESFDVIAAGTSHEAVLRVRERHVDLVLLDLGLPDESGCRTFDRLRALDPLLPVIVITARPDQASSALTAGVVQVMQKPLHVPGLLNTVSKTLGTAAHSQGGTVTETAAVAPSKFVSQVSEAIAALQVHQPCSDGGLACAESTG